MVRSSMRFRVGSRFKGCGAGTDINDPSCGFLELPLPEEGTGIVLW